MLTGYVIKFLAPHVFQFLRLTVYAHEITVDYEC